MCSFQVCANRCSGPCQTHLLLGTCNFLKVNPNTHSRTPGLLSAYILGKHLDIPHPLKFGATGGKLPMSLRHPSFSLLHHFTQPYHHPQFPGYQHFNCSRDQDTVFLFLFCFEMRFDGEQRPPFASLQSSFTGEVSGKQGTLY